MPGQGLSLLSFLEEGWRRRGWAGLGVGVLSVSLLTLWSSREGDSPGARALRISSLPRLLASLSLSFPINKMGVVSQVRVRSQWDEPHRLGVAETSAQEEAALSPAPSHLPAFPPPVCLLLPSSAIS